MRSGSWGKNVGCTKAMTAEIRVKDIWDNGLVEVACPYCAGTRRRPVGRKSGFRLVRCRDCGVVYQCPRMSDAARKARWDGEERLGNGLTFLAHYENGYVWRAELAHLRIDYLNRLGIAGGRLLDLGCATGIFLDAARSRGFDVRGVDLSPVLAGYGKKKYGLDIVAGDFLEVPFPDRSFDVVTGFDVFSSMSRPLESLQKVMRLLKPGGLVWLTASCANIGLWLFREPTPFNVYVTPRTMKAFLEKSGFEKVATKTVVKNANLASRQGVERLLYQVPLVNSCFKKMVEAMGWKTVH